MDNSVTVAVVETGGANTGSVMTAVKRAGGTPFLTSNARAITSAPLVVLPGVGAAGPAMQKLSRSGLDAVIPTLIQPVLGICLGLQLLYDGSEENGGTQCLGLVPGTVYRLPTAASIRVPHCGWNRLHPHRADPLFEELPFPVSTYFVHSYAAPINQYTLASSQHGTVFAAIARRDNFWGMQCHPERSSKGGLQLLKNFIAQARP